jgi:hypothetical protein
MVTVRHEGLHLIVGQTPGVTAAEGGWQSERSSPWNSMVPMVKTGKQ